MFPWRSTMLVCLWRTRRGPRCLSGGRAPGTPTYEGRRWPHPPASRVAVGRHPPASGASALQHAVARGVFPGAEPPEPPRARVVVGRIRLLRGSPLAASACVEGRRWPHPPASRVAVGRIRLLPVLLPTATVRSRYPFQGPGGRRCPACPTGAGVSRGR